MNKTLSQSVSASVRKRPQVSHTGQDRTGHHRTGETLTPTQLTEAHYVALAAEQVRQLDELALIGYAPLDPATRAVYEVALRLAAERVLA